MKRLQAGLEMNSLPAPVERTCFHEADPGTPLARRAAVEFVGTLLLMLAATNAGLVAHRLGIEHSPLALLISALSISGALVALVVAFGKASGGHFNPLITGLQWLAGERKTRCTLAYVAAQFGGGLLGAAIANVAFGASLVPAPAAVASTSMVLSEGIATAGLMIIIFGCSRSGLARSGPFAVGGWLMAAIAVTPSGSYANPVITLAATLVGGSTALPAALAWRYVPAEIAGALAALGVIAIAYPLARTGDETSGTKRDRGHPDAAPGGILPGHADGLISHASSFEEAQTTERLAAAITRHGMEIVARVDHAAAARKAGLSLRYTELLIFGNPKAGTPLMQASQQMGIDLPLKLLVWRDEAGQAWVSYVDPRWLVRRHGIESATLTQAQAMAALLESLIQSELDEAG